MTRIEFINSLAMSKRWRIRSLFGALRSVRSFACSMLAILHVVSFTALTLPHASAQSGDGPVIESVTSSGEGTQGDTQVFSATVNSGQPLASVNLLYRLEGSDDYSKLSMNPIAGTDLYTASIETRDTGATLIQYYFEAIDDAGNRSLSGFAFDPLERVLVPASESAPVTEAPVAETSTSVAVAESEPPATTGGGMSTGRKVLYGVLGVLVVGALVAGASDDSSSGGRQIPIEVTVPPPSTGGN